MIFVSDIFAPDDEFQPMHCWFLETSHDMEGWIHDISDTGTQQQWLTTGFPNSLLSSLSLSPGLAQGGPSWHPWEGAWPRPHLSAPRPDPHLHALCRPWCTFHTPLISQNSDSLYSEKKKIENRPIDALVYLHYCFAVIYISALLYTCCYICI